MWDFDLLPGGPTALRQSSQRKQTAKCGSGSQNKSATSGGCPNVALFFFEFKLFPPKIFRSLLGRVNKKSASQVVYWQGLDCQIFWRLHELPDGPEKRKGSILPNSRTLLRGSLFLMARWVLRCPDCNKNFTHSEIPESSSSHLDPFTGSVIKPEFPDGGQSVVCPNCKRTSVYQRHQLIYQQT
jgi:hypothetical protein